MYDFIINEDINTNDLRRVAVGGIGGVGHVAPVVPVGGVSLGGGGGGLSYGLPFAGGLAAGPYYGGYGYDRYGYPGYSPYPYPNLYSYQYYPY